MKPKKAYIILAHQYPTQLLRLIQRLDDGNSKFFIHIEKRKKINVFSDLLDSIESDKIQFIKQEFGDWGGIGIVKATINALKEIKKNKIRYDFISLLSGQDYPLKSNKEINDFFYKNKEKIFIEYRSLPTSYWLYDGMNRVNDYFIGDRINPDKNSKRRMVFINKIKNRLSIFKRKLPYNLSHFGGSQWWSINFYTLEYILEFIKTHPKYLRFHKYSLLPDELFFQTILLNAKDEKIKNNIVNDNLRYIDWSGLNASPNILQEKDYIQLIKSNNLFARKFDLTIDSKILDAIDYKLLDVSQTKCNTIG